MQEEIMFFGIKIFDWIMLLAIVIGPILAVFVTRLIDWLRDKKQRRLDLFKVMMRTRRTRLSPDHIGALNLVEIEFYKDDKVLNALKLYFQHLSARNLRNGDAGIWLQEGDHLFTKLLSSMARALGYEIEQLEILTGGYAPQAWENDEKSLRDMRQKMIELLDGKRAIPIKPSDINHKSGGIPHGFPPAP